MFVSREMILFFPFFLLRSFIGEVAGVSFAVKKMIYIILHETTCLLLTLLFVIGLAACSKSDDPLPEKVFQDVNKTAEDYLAEEPDLEDYYNFSVLER